MRAVYLLIELGDDIPMCPWDSIPPLFVLRNTLTAPQVLQNYVKVPLKLMHLPFFLFFPPSCLSLFYNIFHLFLFLPLFSLSLSPLFCWHEIYVNF